MVSPVVVTRRPGFFGVFECEAILNWPGGTPFSSRSRISGKVFFDL